MASYGLFRLERGKRGGIAPKVMHDRVVAGRLAAWPAKIEPLPASVS
jgi:hypothetical protein